MNYKKIYFENLDGLRFLCFLSVFFFHSFHTENVLIKSSKFYLFFEKHLFGNGNLGVNFFFVLSGFLITYLLIEEKKLNGQIDINILATNPDTIIMINDTKRIFQFAFINLRLIKIKGRTM